MPVSNCPTAYSLKSSGLIYEVSFLVVSPEKVGRYLPCGMAKARIVLAGMEFAIQLADKPNALGIRKRQFVHANKFLD